MRNLKDWVVPSSYVDEFQNNGVVCIKGLFSKEFLDILEIGIEKNLVNKSSYSKVASSEDDPGWFFEDFCNWQRIEEYKRFIFESKIGYLAAQLMQSQQARLYHDHLLIKEPGTVQKTPWHQDQPYYNVEGSQNISMWVPIDPVSRESTLEFVAGSHKGPWLMPRSFMDNQAKWFPDGSLEDLPDIESNRDQYLIKGWAMEPGDAVFFNMLTLHAAGGVSGTNRRRVFSVRFLGDDMRHAPRPWQTSPPFDGLEKELPSGAEMNHPLFPILTTD